ncbi:MAG: endo-1,4-beta-xylanase [Pirellulales bacterium]|nr:endo-1,4-beta-xylanase [Pirellulales bacterium]
MGQHRFLVHPPERLAPRDLERTFLAGPDYVPWLCRTRPIEGGFLIEREASDSGCLHVPWHVEGHGKLVLTTGTLVERATPYHLEVELARGKINQLRNQIAEWTGMGMLIPDDVSANLREATRQFARAATSQTKPELAAAAATQSLRAALEATEALVRTFADQAFVARHRQAPKLASLLGVNLGTTVPTGALGDALSKAFNTVRIPFSWHDIEADEGAARWDRCDAQLAWCEARQMRICGGPLLAFDRRGLPDWVCLWEGDFENLQELVCDYVRRVVERYKGRVHVWQCAARLYSTEMLELSEEDRLRLAVRAIEVVRQTDPQTPTIICFDRPWADYMRDIPLDLSPLHLGDALVRSGLGLAGLVLEINVGTEPGGSVPRDPLEMSRLIDRWSSLGLPLVVELTLPSSDAPDPRGRPVIAPMPEALPGGWTAAAQQSWVERYAPLLLAKPAVHALVWNQCCDSEPHDYPHAGIIDASGRAKPALGTLARLRREHLQ